MAQPRPTQQPVVMKLIRERRKRMHLSYDRAATRAGISGTRWRQLEDGHRAIRGVGYIPEEAPPATLARMAYVVGVTPDELISDGQPAAGAELADLIELRSREDGETQAEAARAVSTLPWLNAEQREHLEQELAQDIRRIREQDR
jgi:transcriptional regulator with XRE-family HTH domain